MLPASSVRPLKGHVHQHMQTRRQMLEAAVVINGVRPETCLIVDLCLHAGLFQLMCLLCFLAMRRANGDLSHLALNVLRGDVSVIMLYL